jgi:hypothetical protein
MRAANAAARAELLKLDPVGIVAAIFLRCVSALAALRARKIDHDAVFLLGHAIP